MIDDEAPSASEYALARSILRRGAPNIAREYYEMVIASEDPEDYRKYLETVQKLEGKDQSAGGAPVHITIDLGGNAPAIELLPTVVEAPAPAAPLALAKHPSPELAQPTPTPQVLEDDIFDMSSLLGDR